MHTDTSLPRELRLPVPTRTPKARQAFRPGARQVLGLKPAPSEGRDRACRNRAPLSTAGGAGKQRGGLRARAPESGLRDQPAPPAPAPAAAQRGGGRGALGKRAGELLPARLSYINYLFPEASRRLLNCSSSLSGGAHCCFTWTRSVWEEGGAGHLQGDLGPGFREEPGGV